MLITPPGAQVLSFFFRWGPPVVLTSLSNSVENLQLEVQLLLQIHINKMSSHKVTEV